MYVYSWMQSNRLQLNTSKTELLWCTTTRRQHLLPRSALRIGTDAVIPSTIVRDLSIFIHTHRSMRSHVQRTVARYFAVLRQLHSIRRSVPLSVFQTLVVALVLTQLDYTVMLHWLVFRPTYLIVSSLSSTLLLGRLLECDDQTTSLTLLPVFTGYKHLSKSHLNRQSLFIELFMAAAPRYLSDLLCCVADQ